MSWTIRVVAKTREEARAAIERKMKDVALHFPECMQAKDAILALFDAQYDFRAFGYVIESHGGINSAETLVRIQMLREDT